ncbi:exosome complex component RRP40 [Ceratobasidium sp. AG-Ba]|nr:exosome complex component RRP40 [Ceratobasidium sp. AG-Ba]
MFSIAAFPPRHIASGSDHADRSRLHYGPMEIDPETDDELNSTSSRLTSPGEMITSSQAFMRSASTTVPVGDLVVGRIAEVQNKRWKVDVNSRQDGLLLLSSVNLPGGVQRRKLESDELQMRTFFEEAPRLIRRLKSHFFTLPCGVDVIMGLNGYIWVSKHVKEMNQVGEEGFDAEAVYSNKNDSIDTTTLRAIARVSNVIRSLARSHIPLTDCLIEQAYEWVVDQNVEIMDIVSEEVAESMVASVPTFVLRA